MSTRRATVAGLLAAATLVACSSSGGGEPGLQPGPSPAITSPLPQRPQEIRIDDLDPCTVFTTDQLRRLDVTGTRFIPGEEQIGPSCRWLHSPDEPNEAYRVARNADKGIEVTFGNTRGTTVITIAGFPAVETQNERALPDRQCIVALDVAHGQTLQVNYDYSGDTLPTTRELACEKARFAAELAMQTLIERTGG